MAEFESPAYVLELRDRSNCSRIEGIRPGQEISVFVRPENDDDATPIAAKGTLDKDGKWFTVVVTREDGAQQTRVWSYTGPGRLHITRPPSTPSVPSELHKD